MPVVAGRLVNFVIINCGSCFFCELFALSYHFFISPPIGMNKLCSLFLFRAKISMRLFRKKNVSIFVVGLTNSISPCNFIKCEFDYFVQFSLFLLMQQSTEYMILLNSNEILYWFNRYHCVYIVLIFLNCFREKSHQLHVKIDPRLQS